MRRLWCFFLLTSMMYCLVGCGDSPSLTLRDTLTFFNELEDWLTKIPDDDNAEAVAEEFLKNPAYLLKERAKHIKHRWENYKQNDKEAMADVKDAVKYWEKEFKAFVERSKYVGQRLDKIVDRLAEEEAKKFRVPPNRHAKVGTVKELADEAADYEARGQTLKIIEREKVCPNIYEVKKVIADILKVFVGTGPVPREKRKEEFEENPAP